MRKKIVILMILVMTFMVSACGKSDNDRVEYSDNKDNTTVSADDKEETQDDSNQFSDFYTKKFEESFTATYDDPDGKIVFKYPKEMEQTDSNLFCMDPFFSLYVDHGVKSYGENLEDAKVFLESLYEQVKSTTIGGKEAVTCIYEGEQSAGGEYVVFVGGDIHKFITISFAVMPGYAEEYSKVVDEILAGLEFLP